MTRAKPRTSKFTGMCDNCGTSGVEVTRYRIDRVEAEDTPRISRTVFLCAACGAPVAAILRHVEPKRPAPPLRVVTVDELVQTPSLKAQESGKRRSGSSTKSRTPAKRVRSKVQNRRTGKG